MWKLLFVAIGCLYLSAAQQFIDDSVDGQQMDDDNKQIFTIEPSEPESVTVPYIYGYPYGYPSDDLTDPPEPYPYELNICS